MTRLLLIASLLLVASGCVVRTRPVGHSGHHSTVRHKHSHCHGHHKHGQKCHSHVHGHPHH